MKEVYEFLRKCYVYYIASDDNGQPRVRPFTTSNLFEDKIYIETGSYKEFFRQITENPKVEICAYDGGSNWLRIAATLVDDDRVEAKQHLLDANPEIKDRYSADDPKTKVLYLKDATATFTTNNTVTKVVKF